MRAVKRLSNIFAPALAAMALAIGITSVSSACCLWFNQPKMPEALEKYSK